MKHLAIIAALAISASSASAQNDSVEDGFDLLSEGTRMLLRGLMAEMEPALRELQGALQEMDQYHTPEVLPNGDIIIRRKREDEVVMPPDAEDIEI